MGWTGCFIIGVSLIFLSKLAHIPFRHLHFIPLIYYSMLGGLILRFLCHSIHPYLQNSHYFLFTSAGIIVSGISVFIAVILYGYFLIQVYQSLNPGQKKENRDIRILILIKLLGWIFFSLGIVILEINMVIQNSLSFLQNWHIIFVELFIHFTILSICIAVSIRALPLFMRLPAIDWNVKQFSKIYAVILSLFFCSFALSEFAPLQWLVPFKHGFAIVKDILLIWFIIKLNILFKFKKPWTENQSEERVSRKKPSRLYYPDYGEFGRFEYLIKSAFVWLIIGLSLDALVQSSALLNMKVEISLDGIRHIILAGFTSLLIMGMAVRMVPGLLGKKGIEHPNRVPYLAALVNIAVICRTLLLILPESFYSSFPHMGIILLRMYGVSGILFLSGLGLFYYMMKPVLK